jgi:hypothetical protein
MAQHANDAQKSARVAYLKAKLHPCKYCGALVDQRHKVCKNPNCIHQAKSDAQAQRLHTGNNKGIKMPQSQKDANSVRMKALTLAGHNPAKGLSKSLEWKLKMSERMAQGKMGYKASKHSDYVRSDGRICHFRSEWEYKTAMWLDTQEIGWEFEQVIYGMEGTRQTLLPDFHLYAHGKLMKIVEIKGWMDDAYWEKFQLFQISLKEMGIILEMWDGIVLKKLGILDTACPVHDYNLWKG